MNGLFQTSFMLTKMIFMAANNKWDIWNIRCALRTGCNVISMDVNFSKQAEECKNNLNKQNHMRLSKYLDDFLKHTQQLNVRASSDPQKEES